MNILVLGSGGREHAIALKLKESKHSQKIYVAPGNGGTGKDCINIPIDPNNFEDVKKVVKKHSIDMVIVGPEDPLVKGIVDFFRSDDELQNTIIIGPDKNAAMLEGSKSFAKAFMQKYHIPTAKYKQFSYTELNEAIEFLNSLTPPYVIKADGLAAGKGVVILHDLNTAIKELKEFFEGKFGDASKKVVIEEFLNGIELSVFVLVDGNDYVYLGEAKDYKRVGEGDTGPNTGGMGAVTPVPFVDNHFKEKIINQIIEPTISGIKKEKMHYCGFLFFGLMKVNDRPYVIEYNVRMGDPETEVIMPRLDCDLVELCLLANRNQLRESSVNFKKEYFTTVIAVSGGYPGIYEKGKLIEGLEDAENTDDLIIYHAGTKLENDEFVTNGGRVLAFTGKGETLQKALETSYKGIKKVHFDGMYYRKDIGRDLEKFI